MVAVDLGLKMKMFNNRKSLIRVTALQKLVEKELDLIATLDAKMSYSNVDYIIVTPTISIPKQSKLLSSW